MVLWCSIIHFQTVWVEGHTIWEQRQRWLWMTSEKQEAGRHWVKESSNQTWDSISSTKAWGDGSVVMSTHCSPRGPKICCQHPRQTITFDFCRHWYPCVHTSYPIHIIKNNKKKNKNRRKKSENRWVRYLGSRTKPNYVYDYANCKQPKTVI